MERVHKGITPERKADLLVLFDIDGTLLVDDAHAHRRALAEALGSVYAVELPEDAIERVQPWGKTDLQIAREALRAAGLEDRAINRQLHGWATLASRLFVPAAAAAGTGKGARPGLAEALERLARAGMRLTLLTGNLRMIAAVKIERMGLADHLELEIGAYGDDAEQRSELPALARARAGAPGPPWPVEQTVIVGDTPADIAAAQADGLDAIVFSSARFPAGSLEGASAVIGSVEELVATLEVRRGSAR